MAPPQRQQAAFAYCLRPACVHCAPRRGPGFRAMQERELKNGRLAMLAFIGFCGQELATGKVVACLTQAMHT